MIATHSIAKERRRSQRIPLSAELFVRDLDSPFTFLGNLKTVEVSSHGCVLHVLRPLKRDTKLRLDVLYSKHTTTARVVHSYPIGTHLTTWTVALELDKPGNFWGVTSPPPDWPETSEQSRSRESPRSDSVSGTARENQS